MSENNNNGFEPHFQTGASTVEHKNLNQAGDDHPLGGEPMSFEADLRHLIRKVADDLYESWEATIREYLANAETACLRVQHYMDDPDNSPLDDLIVADGYEPKIEVIWNEKEERLTIKDNGIGMAGVEVDQIFRKIGHSASRDYGRYSGQFGMGALSFVKFVGLDNSMTMLTHSRLNGDNFAADVSLAGLEGLRGSLDDDEYGTKFHMSPDGNYNVRAAVERYSEWMRVPVIYREYNADGQEVFNEDWGDKSFADEYDEKEVCLTVEEEGAFQAFCAPDAQARTLLLSMDIDRNDSGGRHGAPFDFDIRLLDEAGMVFKGPHAGMMPCPRSDYKEMLVEARQDHITRDLLKNDDVIGQLVSAGPNEGKMVVSEEAYSSPRLPAGYDYIMGGDLQEGDEPGDAKVILGPSKGRTIVDEETWDELPKGRAELYIPEDELEPFDVEEETGDLALPKPTSDRDRLQSHDVFWKWLGMKFEEEFKGKVDEVFDLIDQSDDPLQTILELKPENLVVSPSK